MDTRGSEWSRWDLHVHTPDSLVHEYGRGGVDPWTAFIDDLEALPAEFRTIGINDYLFLDGYRKVRKAKADGRLPNIDLILPVIELRLNHFGGTDGDLSRINLHVLFSDALTPEVIQAQFINGLKCDVSLLPDAARGKWSSLLTRESLSSLGALVKASLPAEQRANAGTDILEGFNNYNVDLSNVLELLENPEFRHKYFLAVGKTEWADLKWSKQSAAFKKTLINVPHFVFTAVDTPARFEKSRRSLQDAGVNDRLLDCSDAHQLSTSTVSNRIGNSLTWINALPTFEGLRHAFHEYDTRVFVGDEPPKLVTTRTRPTSHIERVTVDVAEGEVARPAFSVDLSFNSGFVAIVGNKGKGKSALTDVLGLLGDSRRSADYSFLTKARFRDPKANLARKHLAKLRWVSGIEVERGLDDEDDPSATETIQYLPQNFLESVCNEGPGSDERFTVELGEVIFSHVPEADRLGTTSLDELVARRSEATRRRIEILRSELSTTVAEIIELEQQLEPTARRHLENQLREKQEELEAHDRSKPAEVRSPEEAAESQSELEHRIELVRTNIAALEGEIQRLQIDANEKSRLLERAQALTKEVDNFVHQFETFLERVDSLVRELGLDPSSMFRLSINSSALDELRQRADNERQAALLQLSPTEDGTAARRATEALAELGDLESELDAPQRAYQNYLTQVVTWEKHRASIVGSPATPDSLENYKYKLEQLRAAPKALSELRERRVAQALAIHEQVREIADWLRDVYKPVQRFIDEHPVVRDRFNLSFEVTIIEKGLPDRLFSMLNRQVTGSFAGTDDGAARLATSIESTDFNEPADVRSFLESVTSDLYHDNRPGKAGKETLPAEQLRKGATEHALFELLYGLEYLTPEFWLHSDDRPISQLSPGQRGTLLLLFYLLIDRSPRPIVLDQPEENLDNQTVHELLVPAIAEARSRRQVIAVTHNPNLAVVGDADQVIVAEMTSDAFDYVSGAIEDPEINQRIVAILEGTWPAFENRRDKYTPTSVLDAQL